MFFSTFKLKFVPELWFRAKTVSPASGAVNVSGTSVQIDFNAPVDSSVRSHLSISPSTEGLWRYPQFRPTVYDSSRIFFHASRAFSPGETYTIRVDDAAIDAYGDSLRGGFSSSFSTIPFGVIGSSPSDGTTGWSTSSGTIFVSFSDSLDTSSVRGAFHIDPATPGSVFPAATFRYFAFRASADLLANTIDTLTVDTSVLSTRGDRLPSPFHCSFLTASGPSATGFRVNYTYPSNGDTLVSRNDVIDVWFNLAIDTATVRSAFSIQPPIAGLLSFPYQSGIRFSPIASFPLSTSYQITLAGSLTSQSGIQLSIPYTLSFRTEPFRVTQTSPSDGETHVSTSVGSIWVGTSDTVDISSLATAFIISPHVSGTVSAINYSPGFTFNPTSPLESYTVYSVTISDSLKSKSGLHIAAPYSFNFATGQ